MTQTRAWEDNNGSFRLLRTGDGEQVGAGEYAEGGGVSEREKWMPDAYEITMAWYGATGYPKDARDTVTMANPESIRALIRAAVEKALVEVQQEWADEIAAERRMVAERPDYALDGNWPIRGDSMFLAHALAAVDARTERVQEAIRAELAALDKEGDHE